MNIMKEIRLDKVTLNIGAGESGPQLDKSKKILETITNKKVYVTKTYKRSTFGVPKGKPIGVKVTLRRKEAHRVLEMMLKSVDRRIKLSSFDMNGNFSFGIKEYINIPGVRYDPDIGILGMDVCVTLSRPGFRIKNRRIKKTKVGKNHRIMANESVEWMKKNYKVVVE